MLGRNKDLTVSLAIVNNFCDVARLKCRLTGFDKHLPSLNGIYQIYSIRKCKLAEKEKRTLKQRRRRRSIEWTLNKNLKT